MRNDTKMGTVHALFTNATKIDTVFRNAVCVQCVPFSVNIKFFLLEISV